MRTLILALLLSPLIASAQPPAPSEAPEGSTAFTSEELEARLKGNTFSFPADGRRNTTVNFSGGVAHLSTPSNIGSHRSESGPWRTQGSAFCITLPAQGQRCNQVREKGGALVVKTKAGWVAFQKE